jgi:hypothetical protein
VLPFDEELALGYRIEKLVTLNHDLVQTKHKIDPKETDYQNVPRKHHVESRKKGEAMKKTSRW